MRWPAVIIRATFSRIIFNDDAVLASYFQLGDRRYHAVDDLLRLTRRLKQQKLFG